MGGVTTHGMSGTTEHRAWILMRYRCVNKNCDAYYRYGKRGISVCKRWNDSFQNFFDDMGKRPPGKELDRIDNNKGYSPRNCRWATAEQNIQNSSLAKLNRKKVLEIRKSKLSVINLSKKYGVARGCIYNVLKRLTWRNIA